MAGIVCGATIVSDVEKQTLQAVHRIIVKAIAAVLPTRIADDRQVSRRIRVIRIGLIVLESGNEPIKGDDIGVGIMVVHPRLVLPIGVLGNGYPLRDRML